MTWQPDGWNDDMNEAPKDGTRILLHFPTLGEHSVAQARYVPSGQLMSRDVWDGGTWWVDPDSATHWRYLPSPPSKQED